MMIETQIMGRTNIPLIGIDGWVTEISQPFGGQVFDTTINKKKQKSFSKEQLNYYNTDCYYLDVTVCNRINSKGVVAEEWMMYHVFSVNQNGTINLYLISNSRYCDWYSTFTAIQKIIRITPSINNSKKDRGIFFNLRAYAFDTHYANCSIHINQQTWEVKDIFENVGNAKNVKDLITGTYVTPTQLYEYRTDKFYYSMSYVGNTQKDKNHYDYTFFTVNLNGSLNILDAVILTNYPEGMNPDYVTKTPILERDFHKRIYPIYMAGIKNIEPTITKDLTLLKLRSKALKIKALALSLTL